MTTASRPVVGGTVKRRAATIVPALVAGLLVGAAPASAATPTCLGRPATIVARRSPTNGTEGPDVIVGAAPSSILIDGRGGNDLICSGRGGNFIRGGTGNDVLIGVRAPSWRNRDDFDGGPGRDRINGRGGRDVVHFAGQKGIVVDLAAGTAQTRAGTETLAGIYAVTGTSGDDILRGTNRGNSLSGRDGDDILSGRGGRDRITGGNGGDRLSGGDGADWLFPARARSNQPGSTERVRGGGGNDIVEAPLVADGASVYDGGRGRDLVAPMGTTSGVHIDLAADTLRSGGVEWLVDDLEDARGTAGDDVLLGGGDRNRLWAMDGNDTVNGRGGNDRVVIWAHTDHGSLSLAGGAGVDELQVWLHWSDVDLAANTLSTKRYGFDPAVSHTISGFQHFRGDGGIIRGDARDNRLTTDHGGHVVIYGRGGNDTIVGSIGADELHGGAGNDRLRGRKGSDAGNGGSGSDTCRQVEQRISCLNLD